MNRESSIIDPPATAERMPTPQAVKARVQQWIRPEIRALAAYHVPPAADVVKLDAMENPYHWPPALTAEWQQRLAAVEINRYPDPRGDGVKTALREAMRIPEELGVLLGNGSDEIIQMLAMAVAAPGRTLLAPEPGFAMYPLIAALAGLEYVGVPLDADFDLDVDAMLAAMAEHQPALTFLALPNNPTGNVFDSERLRQVVEASSGLVVLDEAYAAFTDADHLDWASRYPHVLVMRTLSKVGLAALRLGFLIGAPAWLEELEKIRLPYNINTLTQVTVQFALEHYEVLRQQTKTLRDAREELGAALAQLPGLTVWPSQANFLLIRCSAPARQVFDGLRGRGVLVKCLDGSHPALAGCLRLTVGSAEDNASLLEALRAELG